MEDVTLYRFTIYDIATDERRVSRRMGTLEGIKRVCGEPVEGEGCVVDASKIQWWEPGLTERDYYLTYLVQHG